MNHINDLVISCPSGGYKNAFTQGIYILKAYLQLFDKK